MANHYIKCKNCSTSVEYHFTVVVESCWINGNLIQLDIAGEREDQFGNISKSWTLL